MKKLKPLKKSVNPIDDDDFVDEENVEAAMKVDGSIMNVLVEEPEVSAEAFEKRKNMREDENFHQSVVVVTKILKKGLKNLNPIAKVLAEEPNATRKATGKE